MGFLYPRLLAGQAKPMHEAYRRMTLSDLTERVATNHKSAVYVATGGDRISEKGLRELRELVVGLAREAGFPNESTRQLRAAFDLGLAAALHAEMGVVPAEAASGDVWAFLALVLLPDVAYWRYPKPPGDRVLGTDLTRHVFGRMWWRAQLVHSPEDPAPYAALKVLGEAAFDQIYARRKALGGSPHLVKAILRVWNDLDLRGIDEREALRDFLKRLLRLAPFVLFESLSDQNLDGELRAVGRESVTAMVNASLTGSDDLQAKVDAVFARSQNTIANSELGSTAMTASDEDSAVSPPTVQPDHTPLTSSAAGVGQREGESRNGPLPYNAYGGPGFGDPRILGLRERAEAIVAVVAVEGPVKAERVYRLITQLAGTRLRGTASDLLVDATKHAVRTGGIVAENQVGRGGYLGATLRMPGQSFCVLRERGPRDLEEIPDREIVAAAKLVQVGQPTIDLIELVKKTSQVFGYERSTPRFREALIDALQKYGT
jgi:hypothetical protein